MSDGTFLISLTGQLEWIEILASTGSAWHCKYELISGTDWKIINGLDAALSQTALIVTNGDKIVFNLPIEIIYKSTNPYGWPQIIISLYRNMSLEGYGRVHVPLQAGTHELIVSLSKPMPSSMLGYIGSFFGYQPELLQPKTLANTSGSHLIRMISNGYARISFNVLTQNVQSLGYDVGHVH